MRLRPQINGQISSHSRAIDVRTYKYDGTLHHRWRAKLSRHEGQLLVLNAAFEKEIRHPLLGTIELGTLSIEYYWLDSWYNIFRFQQPGGELRNFYCNVNVPPVFNGETLSYIDLDMDIFVAPDLSFTVLDRDEFAVNAARFNYPDEIRRRSERAIEELISLIETRQFPFADLR